MAKERIAYECTSCGTRRNMSIAICPKCKAQNAYVQLRLNDDKKEAKHVENRKSSKMLQQMAIPLSQIDKTDLQRYVIGGDNPTELDRVLGSGIVPGSLILLAGDPGAGKTSLFSRVAHELTRFGKVLYVSAEESQKQIRMRAERIGAISDDIYVVYSDILEDIIDKHIPSLPEEPLFVFIDSINEIASREIDSSPGSEKQLMYCTSMFQDIAKSRDITFFFIAQVTKNDEIRGSLKLSHAVDCVLFLETDNQSPYRMLRSVKNRFGEHQLGVYEMTETGMIDVPNPSAAFLSERNVSASGSAISIYVDGTSAIAYEVQALITSATGFPQRKSQGIHKDILEKIADIEAKHIKYLGTIKDDNIRIYAIGGLRINESAADLAVATAIASSLLDVPIPSDMVHIGDIDLSGSIRQVQMIELRLQQAYRSGFKRIIAPPLRRNTNIPDGVEVIQCRTLEDSLFETFRHSEKFQSLF